MAELPTTTQTLIAQYLEAVRHDPEHHLKPSKRIALYESFGPSTRETNISKIAEQHQIGQLLNLSLPDSVLAHLAVLTAEKVFPIWEQAWLKRDINIVDIEEDVVLIFIESAKKALSGDLGLAKAALKLHDYHETLGALAYDFDYAVHCASMTAHEALATVVNGLFYKVKLQAQYGILSQYRRLSNSADDETPASFDFAAWGAKAWAAKDGNSPGEWTRVSTNFANIYFDPQKRLEFWEWWLTEAIPRAWQMAETANHNS